MILCGQKHRPSRYENKQNTFPNLKEQTDSKRYNTKKTVIYLFFLTIFKDVFPKNILITFKESGLPVSKGKICPTLIGRDTFVSWACRNDIF